MKITQDGSFLVVSDIGYDKQEVEFTVNDVRQLLTELPTLLPKLEKVDAEAKEQRKQELVSNIAVLQKELQKLTTKES